MAPVVKWSRPRIVVPICMGSNPIRRPIKKTLAFVKVFCQGLFYLTNEDKNPFEGSSEERAECGGLFFGRNEVSEKKIRRHV